MNKQILQLLKSILRLFHSFVSLFVSCSDLETCQRSSLTQEYRFKLTAASDGLASSMIKTPSVVILTPSRDDIRSVQPSETESKHLSAALMILLSVYFVCYTSIVIIGVENEITIQFHPTPTHLCQSEEAFEAG